jgi:hypothetical protein
MGACVVIPILRSKSISDAFDSIAETNVSWTIYVADSRVRDAAQQDSSKSIPFYSADFTKPFVLVIGSEVNWNSKTVRELFS